MPESSMYTRWSGGGKLSTAAFYLAIFPICYSSTSPYSPNAPGDSAHSASHPEDEYAGYVVPGVLKQRG